MYIGESYYVVNNKVYAFPTRGIVKDYCGKLVFGNEDECNFKNGCLDSEDDMPALITKNYVKWYKEGKLHRSAVDKYGNQKPAFISNNGKIKYYIGGKLHRNPNANGEIGPAVILENGTEKWYHKGKLHREDGPAVIYANGDYQYYKQGKLHSSSDNINEPTCHFTSYKNIANRYNSPLYNCYAYNIPPIKEYLEWWVEGKLIRTLTEYYLSL